MAKEPMTGSGRHFIRGAFLAILLLLFCWQVVQASWFFNLEYVHVTGNETLSSRQVEEIAGVWKGTQLLKIDLNEVEKRLVTDPRIVSAHASRAFPNKLVLSIEENIGLAVLPYCDGFVEIDRGGKIVSIVSNFSQINLPIITGVTLINAVLGDKPSGLLFGAALDTMGSIPTCTRPIISEINISPQAEVAITTTDGIHIKFGTTNNASSRLALLPAVLYAYEVRGFDHSTVAYIDMTGEIPVYKGR